MKLFATYLLIGAIFAFIIDSLTDHWETENRFTNLERIVVILIWPISLFIFVVGFIKEIRKK